MRARHLAVVLGLAVMALPVPGSAYQRPSSTVEVTVSTDGAPGDGEPDGCSSSIACDAFVDITPDGRSIAFNTSFTNLVPDDTNDRMDVFVRDQEAGTTERVSVAWDGSQADGTSGEPSISDNGRYVTFTSNATNLVPGGTIGEQIFVRDRLGATTFVASVSNEGVVGTGTSGNAEISGNGRYVAFWSSSFGDPYTVIRTRGGEVYVRDLLLGTTERVAKTDTGDETEGVETYRSDLAINADGRFVAWEARHHNITPGDINGNVDIFLRDRDLRTTERITVNDDGEGANWASYAPNLSADGRFVVFNSFGTNLVPADGNGRQTAVFGGGVGGDVFVRDRELGTTHRVNVSSTGAEDDQGGDFAAISADGRFIAFTSTGTTLVPGATDYRRRVYRHDRITGETTIASVPSVGGHTQTAFVGAPALSEDGGIAVYAGNSANSPFEVAAYATTLGGSLGVVSTSVLAVPEGLQVSGTFVVSGAEAAAATDALGDGTAAVGGDLVGARVIVRPESDDVLIEIEPSTLPSSTTMTPGTNYAYPGRPEITVTRYEVSFVSGGNAYVVRAGIDPVAGVGARFSLTGCTPACARIADLPGSWGGRGTVISVALPRSILATTKMGGLHVTALTTGVDTMDLDEAVIAVPTVRAGTALPGGVPVYSTAADLAGGTFSATIAAGSLPQGPYEVWARTCFAGTCRERRAA